MTYTIRDRIVCAICNWLLNHVASERYRKMVGGAIRYGMQAAADGYEPRDFATPDDPVRCHLCGKDTSLAMIVYHLETEHGIDPEDIADAPVVEEP